MGKHFNKLLLAIFGKRIKTCNHGFEIKEVVNLNIDPLCKNCGKSLSELTILSNGAALTTINNKL